MKIDQINNNTSIGIEEQSVRGINAHYQVENKTKPNASAEKVSGSTDAVEERKKQAQKEAMQIAHDAWEEGRVIEHKPSEIENKISSVKQERMENIRVTSEPEQVKVTQAKPELEMSEMMQIASEAKQAKSAQAAPKPEQAEIIQVVLESGKAKTTQMRIVAKQIFHLFCNNSIPFCDTNKKHEHKFAVHAFFLKRNILISDSKNYPMPRTLL